ncbi:hypothetical protein BJ741DRAFT_424792 [Chytriomyces cf. hyalinus JEL632]|nr:hypothetical protein BJ741DRAFT_424792 [Chytriomyces cf. hyalinus JEL632]
MLCILAVLLFWLMHGLAQFDETSFQCLLAKTNSSKDDSIHAIDNTKVSFIPLQQTNSENIIATNNINVNNINNINTSDNNTHNTKVCHFPSKGLFREADSDSFSRESWT